MISHKHLLKGPQNIPGQAKAGIHSPQLPTWFHRFTNEQEPNPHWKTDSSDLFYPSELRCPNCDQLSFDSICRCGAMIQHPDSGDFSCN